MPCCYFFTKLLIIYLLSISLKYHLILKSIRIKPALITPTSLINSVVEVFERNSTEMVYKYETSLPLEDVTYYIRAYVKTNAGTGYSNIIAISTVD